jgi:uncharacterized protein
MTQAAPGRAGLAVLDLAQAGRFADIRDMFAPQLRALVSAESLQAAWQAEVDRRGSVTSAGPPSASQPAAIEAMTSRAKLVDSAELSAATPASELPFGAPAAYWLDLREYHPAEVAAGLGKPILIVQGARDYQVTVADDLAGGRP